MRTCTRLILAALLLAAAGGALPAAAAPIVELRFRSSGHSVVTLAPGQTAWMDVVLVSDVPLIAATLVVYTDRDVAPILGAVNTSGPFIDVPFGYSPEEAGTFGGLTLSRIVGPGSYDLGDILFTAGDLHGTATIGAMQRERIDDWYDATFQPVEPQLGTASIIVIPEPDTLLLVGLGFAILAARRRPAR